MHLGLPSLVTILPLSNITPKILKKTYEVREVLPMKRSWSGGS